MRPWSAAGDARRYPRHGYHNREIDGPPTVEEPPRLIRQLHGVARGLMALGCNEDDTARLCRRVALDSMPLVRHAVLSALTVGASSDTSKLAGAARLDRGVTRRALEELAAIGVVLAKREGGDPGEGARDHRPCTWRLDDDGDHDGALIRSVFELAASDNGCSKICNIHTSHPPDGG